MTAIYKMPSESFYLKLATTCKNLFLSLVVVRLVIFKFQVKKFQINRYKRLGAIAIYARGGPPR